VSKKAVEGPIVVVYIKQAFVQDMIQPRLPQTTLAARLQILSPRRHPLRGACGSAKACPWMDSGFFQPDFRL